jgi:hypothetical protein
MDIQKITVHQVGNKYKEEELTLSDKVLEVSEEALESLTVYFTKPFGERDFHRLSHVNDLEMNEVYQYVFQIFEQPDSLQEQSIKLAKHLFEISEHPKIKSGEFYVVYFTNCQVEGKAIDAVGLFKSESKDKFIKVKRQAGGFVIESQEGVNINKLDKGCVVYNMEREEGYVVSVVDNTNRNTEARYWMDDFLQLKERKDEFHQTKNAMDICQNFIKEGMNREFEVSKAEQAELLANSMKFFKTNDNFNVNDFNEEVIAQPEVIEEFKSFRNKAAEERGVTFEDEFDISPRAVKKSTKNFKSIIKLDKNFHIYVHGNPNLITRDEDENGKFYKVYFREES